jgi:hypothetical protein
MPWSSIGGKVPKLIVRDVFRNIPRYYCAKKKNIIMGGIRNYALLNERRGLLPLDYRNLCAAEKEVAKLYQQSIFPINLGIFHYISQIMVVRKNLKYWKSVNK